MIFKAILFIQALTLSLPSKNHSKIQYSKHNKTIEKLWSGSTWQFVKALGSALFPSCRRGENPSFLSSRAGMGGKDREDYLEIIPFSPVICQRRSHQLLLILPKTSTSSGRAAGWLQGTTAYVRACVGSTWWHYQEVVRVPLETLYQTSRNSEPIPIPPPPHTDTDKQQHFQGTF